MNIEELRRNAQAATPGPWILATSNSWRRFMSREGRSVCEPIKQNDGHPDLYFKNGGSDGPDARHIAGCNPQTILRLCEVAAASEQDRQDAARYRWLRAGQRMRQGQPTGTGRRLISQSPERALLSFNFWCSPEELDAAIDAALGTSGEKTC